MRTGRPQKYSQADIITMCIATHGEKYSYKDTVYINTGVKIKITCPIHGSFEQRPMDHITGKGCIECSKLEFNFSKNEILKKFNEIHGDKYSYRDVNYTNNYTKIIIICKIHGTFNQLPKEHLKGRGCQKCANDSFRCLLDDFIFAANKIHDEEFLYKKVKYINSHTKIIIICHKHGEFEQTPNSHLLGTGCPKCTKVISKPEIEWLDYLGVLPQFRHKTIMINGRRFNVDAFDSTKNIIYEFYGDYWHGNPKVFDGDKIHPIKKLNYKTIYNLTIERENVLKSLGYKMVSIWENDWNKRN